MIRSEEKYVSFQYFDCLVVQNKETEKVLSFCKRNAFINGRLDTKAKLEQVILEKKFG